MSKETIPDKMTNESNFEYCNRVANLISPESLVSQMFTAIAYQCKRSKTKTFQGELSKLLYYGNGVRCALERKYLGDSDPDVKQEVEK